MKGLLDKIQENCQQITKKRNSASFALADEQAVVSICSIFCPHYLRRVKSLFIFHVICGARRCIVAIELNVIQLQLQHDCGCASTLR